MVVVVEVVVVLAVLLEVVVAGAMVVVVALEVVGEAVVLCSGVVAEAPSPGLAVSPLQLAASRTAANSPTR